MTRTTLAALAAFLCLPAFAQIPAPRPVPPGKLKAGAVVVVKVPSAAPSEWTPIVVDAGELATLSTEVPVQWTLVDDTKGKLKASEDGKTAVFAGPPGRYKLLAYPGERAEPSRYELTVGDAPPDPLPPVPPGPVPPVPPGPGPLPPVPPDPKPPDPARPVKKFVIVEDTLKAGPWRGDLLGSPAFATLLNQDGLKYRIIDKNAPEEADAEAKAFLAAAEGKPAPWMWTFDAAGNQIESVAVPKDSIEQFMVKVTGQPQHQRAMGNRAPPAKKYAWKLFGKEPNVPINRDRTTWKTVDLTAFLPPVYDQDGRGQCNASATCTVIEAARKQAGLPPVKLSAGDLYSQINGGQDDGSTLEDGLFAAMKNGVATAAKVPYVWDGKNHGKDATVLAERKLYVVLEAYECPDFDAMASALQQGFFIVEGLMWYGNFTPDRDGWLPARGTGRPGGHALCGKGLVQRDGVWGIKTRNSWSASWGKAGDCIIPESLFGQAIGGYWAVRAVRQTGGEFPVAPKVAKLSVPDAFASNLPPVLKP